MYVFIKEGDKPVATAQKGISLINATMKMKRIGYDFLGEIGATWGAVSNDFIPLMDYAQIDEFCSPDKYTLEAKMEVLTIKIRTLELEAE